MERHRITVDGEPFSYLTCGPPDGRLVLCLHGFPDIPQTWEPVAQRLAARGFRVVAPYMRGYAPSTLQGPFDADRLGADALALVRALSGGERAFVVGHDWGAVATYVAAGLEPELLDRVVTLAVPHPLAFLGNMRHTPDQLRRSWYMGFFQLPVVPELALKRDGWALVERLWRRWSPGFEPPAEHLRALEQCFEASMPAPIEYYRAMLWPPVEAAARMREGQQEGRRVNVPCLYLHGADDGCVGFELARDQERYFAAGLEAELLARCGHFLQLERPEAVAERILEWIAD